MAERGGRLEAIRLRPMLAVVLSAGCTIGLTCASLGRTSHDLDHSPAGANEERPPRTESAPPRLLAAVSLRARRER
jgi:hypothetical protein